MKDLNRFYTYAYLREDGTPYYIGKGEGNRLYYKKKSEIKPPKDKSRIIFLKQNLLEEEAFKHEIYMIAVFGRKDLGTGILRNRTDGGEGSSGWVPSEETRRKISISNTGKTHSKETREKLSEINKGENSPKYGKSPSQETRRKQSEVMVDRKWWNDGCGNNKFSIECPGEGWFLGRGEESRKKQSEVLKGEKNHNYGKKWWNDGEENIIMSVECPGEGWFPGRGNWWNDGCGNSKRSIKCPGEGWFPGMGEEIRKKQSEIKKGKGNSNLGRKWWNDGCGNNKRSVECPGEGWVLGMTKNNE